MALTQERLKELLRYDPETGLFYWLKSTSKRVRPGAVAGCACSDGYTRIRIDGVLYLAQRLAWFYVNGEWPSNEIDHENRDKSDNRFANLRDCTHAENGRNRSAHKDNPVGIKGVHQDRKSKRWIARICVNRSTFNLGSFNTRQEASAAYDMAAQELHGTFACINEAA